MTSLAQQLGAAVAVHGNGALADVLWAGRMLGGLVGIDLHANGVVQQTGRQRFHVLREGGREQQGLALRGQQGQHAVEFFGKALVQQAVGFVQHQMLHGIQAHGVVLHQIQQAARRGDQKVGAAAQLHHLRVDGDTAIDHAAAWLLTQLARDVAQAFVNLQGQARAWAPESGWPAVVQSRSGRALRQPGLQQRQQVGHGLARACGRAGPEIAPGQHGGDGLGLNRRRVAQTQIECGIQKLGAQA